MDLARETRIRMALINEGQEINNPLELLKVVAEVTEYLAQVPTAAPSKDWLTVLYELREAIHRLKGRS